MILMRPPAHVVASVRLAGCCLAYACLHDGGRPRACGSQNVMTMKKLLLIALLMAAAAVRAVAQPYLGERLGRGMVGIWSGAAMFLSWRMLPTDPDTMAFDVYRSAGGREVRLNSEPIVASSCFADSSAGACGPARWRLVSGRVDCRRRRAAPALHQCAHIQAAGRNGGRRELHLFGQRLQRGRP